MCGEVLMVDNIRAQHTVAREDEPMGWCDSLHLDILGLIFHVATVDDCQTIDDEKAYLRDLR